MSRNSSLESLGLNAAVVDDIERVHSLRSTIEDATGVVFTKEQADAVAWSKNALGDTMSALTQEQARFASMFDTPGLLDDEARLSSVVGKMSSVTQEQEYLRSIVGNISVLREQQRHLGSIFDTSSAWMQGSCPYSCVEGDFLGGKKRRESLRVA